MGKCQRCLLIHRDGGIIMVQMWKIEPLKCVFSWTICSQSYCHAQRRVMYFFFPIFQVNLNGNTDKDFLYSYLFINYHRTKLLTILIFLKLY